MKTTNIVRRIRSISALGLLGCTPLFMTPFGCASSIRAAPHQYRAQHQDDAHLLPDITVERFQECAEIYGEQLGPIDPPLAHAKGHVQVTPEGQVVDVQVTGIPDRAPDLAACTRITLRQMTVPASVLSLRQKKTSESTAEQTVPRGNEIGNPIVLWEIGVLLAEFAAQHGGRIVLYTVTIEVLTAAGVVAVATLQEMKKCRRQLTACLLTSVADLPGNHPGHSRCKLCFDHCMNIGKWPGNVPIRGGTGSCYYDGQE